MGRQEGIWTRETEATAVARLRSGSTAGPIPVVLVYTRQSVSKFDEAGEVRGLSLGTQYDACIRRA